MNSKATVKALDRDLNKLDVTIEPLFCCCFFKSEHSFQDGVDSTKANRQGKGWNQDHEYRSVDPKEVTLFGSETELGENR